MLDEILTDLSTTICAVSTPHGAGGIAVIRASGPEAIEIVGKVWRGAALETVMSHTAHLGQIVDPDDKGGEPLDQCVATVFRAPRSYTGQDTVELSVHGSKWIQREVISLLIRQGARLATRGEFTRRALAAGNLDLAQAEGVADLIASESRAAHRIAMRQMKGSVTRALASLREQLIQLASLIELELDFSEEDVEFVDRSQLAELTGRIIAEVDRLHDSYARGNAIKEGIPVAIVGPTNAGKSSLLNLLLNDNRAIVSDIHGTTRDTIEETLEVGNYLFRFIDTAGLRDTSDPIEQIGISRSRSAIANASIIIAMVDARDLIYDSHSTPAALLHNILTAILPLNPEQSDSSDNSDNSDNDNTLSDNDNTITSPLDDRHLIIAINKIDLIPHPSILAPLTASAKTSTILISTKNAEGLPTLFSLLEAAATDTDSDQILITSQRQAQALAAASTSLHTLHAALLSEDFPTDLLAFHLREAIHHLSTVTDPITTPDILNSIFQSFCIGK